MGVKARYKLKSCDEYVYYDDEYEIIKKGGEVTGTLDSSFVLLSIALTHLESEECPHLFHKKDFEEIVNKWIERLEKIKINY